MWIRFADWFRRPLRLTPPEGLALVAAARALLSVPGQGGTGADSALNSAVAKLEMVLGAGGDEALDIELGRLRPRYSACSVVPAHKAGRCGWATTRSGGTRRASA